MSKTIKITAYELKELEGSAKERAFNWMREGVYNFEWWDAVYEDFLEVAQRLGFTIDLADIQFQAYCQGAGASFSGRAVFDIDAVAKIKDFAPIDKELARIAAEIAEYAGWRFNIMQDGYGVHEYTMQVVDIVDALGDDIDSEDTTRALLHITRDLARWLHTQLVAEIDYQTSEEALLEDAEANEMLFDVDGRVI